MRFITVTIAIVLAATAVPAFAQDGPDGAVYRTRFPGHTFVLCRLA